MRTLLLIGVAVALAAGQMRQETEPPPGPAGAPLPGGRNQTEEILKAEHQKSLQDAVELVRLSRQLRTELERNDRYIVSVSSIKKTEEIEKLARRIRARLKRN
jgi:hypothetical protein